MCVCHRVDREVVNLGLNPAGSRLLDISTLDISHDFYVIVLLLTYSEYEMISLETKDVMRCSDHCDVRLTFPVSLDVNGKPQTRQNLVIT